MNKYQMVILLVLVFLVSCTQATSEELATIGPTAARVEAQREMPTPGSPRPELGMTSKVSLYLSERLGIDASEVTLVGISEVVWPDGSLGCPATDMSYIMVEIPGYEINLAVGENPYIYHTDQSDTFLLCEDGHPV